MLLVDLKGTLKYMPEEGNLYMSQQIELNNPENSVLSQLRADIEWDEQKIEVIESENVPMPEYQKDLHQAGTSEVKDYKLKDTIENWPDFIYTRYHPRSINIVKEFEHSDEFTTLDTFSSGMKLWETSTFEDNFCDNIRAYIEECHHCQGFQTLFDVVDGFSGLTIKCMEYLEDEYSKTIFGLPFVPPKIKSFKLADDPMSDSIRIINTAFSYAKLSEFSSLFVPLSTMGRASKTVDEPRIFPFASYESTNLYHSSAILSSFVDTMSLRYRLKDSQASSSLTSFCSELNAYGRKMAGGKIAFPFPMNEKEDLIDFLDRFSGELMQSVTPGVKVGTDRIIQSISLRGIPKTRLKRPLEQAKNQMKMAAYKCGSISEMMQLFYQCNTYASLSHVSSIESRMKVKSPFPREFFDKRLAPNGFVREFQTEDVSCKLNIYKLRNRNLNTVFSGIEEIPMMTAVQNSNEIADTLENLHTTVSRIKIVKIPRFLDSGLETEEYKELLEQLLVFKEQYDESFFL